METLPVTVDHLEQGQSCKEQHDPPTHPTPVLMTKKRVATSLASMKPSLWQHF